MEINQKIHLLDGTEGSFSYLVLGDEPVLVDTSLAARRGRLVQSLEQCGLKPSDLAHIVLTHMDVDHIGNARWLQEASGATLWAPEVEVPYIHGERKAPGLRGLIQTMMKVERPKVTATFREGEKIGDLEVIPAPGHTIGHVCLLSGDVLLAGDLVNTRNGKLRPSPGFLTWDKVALQRSLRDVGRRPFDWVCPAHGRPIQRASWWDVWMN